jgi:phosphomannomutase
MITASHNPPRYNGIKFKASYGGPAMPEVTQSIEWRLAEGLRKSKEPPVIDWEEAEAHGIIERFDPMPAYLEHVRSLVDLPLIADSGLNVVIDPIYGAGRGYIKELLEKTGCNTFEIHGQMNPGFGGIHPEPIERNLQELIETVKGGPYDVGLAMDGDADRIGAVDARGCFVDPHRIFALALRHLVEGRGLRGEVVKTVSTTQMVELLAENYNLPLYETPVGFNHICKLMLEKDILIGGEESGGITVKGHIPEGDGILMGLLLLEIIASCGKPLHVIIDELMYDIGRFHYGRNDLEVKAFSKKELVNRLTSHPPFRIAGLRVKGMNCKDGVKYLLEDDSWLLIRPSGTEPVLRIYAEARSEEGVFELLAWGRELAEGF